MITSGMFTSTTPEWSTPQSLFYRLDSKYNFTLDPCSTHENAKCEKHYTLEEDGLSQDWSRDIVFMNPPYGRQIYRWVKKAYETAIEGGGSSLFIASPYRYKMVSRVLYEGKH